MSDISLDLFSCNQGKAGGGGESRKFLGCCYGSHCAWSCYVRKGQSAWDDEPDVSHVFRLGPQYSEYSK